MHSTDKPTLLVVEDNAVISSMLQKTIRSRRGSTIQIVTAINGKEGIEAAKRQRPDLILLDWMMPEYDGEFFLKEQAAMADIAGIPVLIHTAVDEREVKNISQQYPSVKLCLHKPITPSKIYETLTPYLKRQPRGPDGAVIPPASAAPAE